MSERVASPGTVIAEARDATSLSVLDRTLYALFARHADDAGHATDRHHYRGTDLRVSFDLYLARVYGLSWAAFLAAAGAVGVVAAVGGLPTPGAVRLPAVGATLPVPGEMLVAAATAVVGWGAKESVVRLGGVALRWRAAARRSDVERTLPSAVRYLHVLSSGSDAPRTMLRKVADTSAYGETAVSMRKAMNTAALTGSLDEGLRRVDASMSRAFNRLEAGYGDERVAFSVAYNRTAAERWVERNCPSGPRREFGPCLVRGGIVLQERAGEAHALAVAVDVQVLGDRRTTEATFVVLDVGRTAGASEPTAFAARG